MNVADIRHLFDYTEWANRLVMDAAATLPDEQLRGNTGISHHSIFGTLLHMSRMDLARTVERAFTRRH